MLKTKSKQHHAVRSCLLRPPKAALPLHLPYLPYPYTCCGPATKWEGVVVAASDTPETATLQGG